MCYVSYGILQVSATRSRTSRVCDIVEGFRNPAYGLEGNQISQLNRSTAERRNFLLLRTTQELTMAGQHDREENLSTLLKPFHDRAKLAEERLEKLEAALIAQKGSAPQVDGGILESLVVLKSKLEASRAQQLAEREKAAKELATLSGEKEKLQYQIVHLKRSLEDADKKLLKQSLGSN